MIKRSLDGFKIWMEEYTLPAPWACWLINGDLSGLSDEDIAEVDAWMADNDYPHFCDVGEPYFSWTNDANDLGGDVATYTAIIQ
jgi:hypothetical protein